MSCEEPECAGMGKCLRSEHVDRRARLAFDRDAIEAWLKRQSHTVDVYVGVCEYDHHGEDELIAALLAEVDSLRSQLAVEKDQHTCARYEIIALRGRSLE